MNPYVNMGVAGLLSTVLVVMTVSFASKSIFQSPDPEKEGFTIAAEETSGEGADAGEAVAAATPIADLLATADATAGEAVYKKCVSCHTDTKGGPNKVGPNLYGLIDRPIATHEGFAYSAAMKDFSKGGSEVWSYEHLNHFLAAPKKYVAGTAMGFAGLKKDEERANLIAYLRTMADAPVPLPTPGAAEGAAAPAAEAPAPAAEAAPAAEPAAPAGQ